MIRKTAFSVITAVAVVFASACQQDVVSPPADLSPRFTRPAPGVDSYTQSLTFPSGGGSFSFYVESAQGTGTLSVSTRDCCLVGDLWVSFLEHGQPSGQDVAIGTGDGNTSTFSGVATRKGWSKGIVTISYRSGTNVFPAGMTVLMDYSSNGSGKTLGNTGMIVTPIP